MAVLAERDRADKARFDILHSKDIEGPLTTFARLMAHNTTVPKLVQLFTVLAAESIQPDQPGTITLPNGIGRCGQTQLKCCADRWRVAKSARM